MAYGLKTWNSAGQLTFDSTRYSLGGVVVGWIDSTASQQVITYPDFPGRTNAGYIITSGWMPENQYPVWDYALGYPRVTIPAHGVSAYGYPFTFSVILVIL